MATHYVTIIVDCESIVGGTRNPPAQIQMFADNSTTVLNDSQGTHELAIQVNSGDDIQWIVYPKAPPRAGADSYSVLVSQTYAWNDATLLKTWTAYQGAGQIFVYKQDGENIAPSNNGDAAIIVAGDYRPFVEAHASLPGRPDPGSKQTEAYTFYINIYKGSNTTPVVRDYSWDPYVTVVQP